MFVLQSPSLRCSTVCLATCKFAKTIYKHYSKQFDQFHQQLQAVQKIWTHAISFRKITSRFSIRGSSYLSAQLFHYQRGFNKGQKALLLAPANTVS